mgnify:FL=1
MKSMKNSRIIDIQRIVDGDELPNDGQLEVWVNLALSDYQQDAEVVIRIVAESEMLALNSQYRDKPRTTNILSFPFEVPEGVEGIDLLGDLVVCAVVLQQESVAQGKNLHQHWAHIIMHGVLHLLGYDHEEEREALEMEGKEIELLEHLNISNPYQEN